MTTPHTTPPDGARFIMLKLESGNEIVGWHDRTHGYQLKSGYMTNILKVEGWRELTDHERNNIGLNE